MESKIYFGNKPDFMFFMECDIVKLILLTQLPITNYQLPITNF
ncbi:hypothetical protein BGP_2170 [Beggiatoa sp. PS]|nr:hypothetical protein BGP_2170 [Beggiatoa sp. PS]